LSADDELGYVYLPLTAPTSAAYGGWRLLFIGEGSDAILGTPQVDWGWGKKFRAYDKSSGQVIWEIDLPSGTTGGPMTYMARGRQFIVVPVGGKDHPAELVALALPDVRTSTGGHK
jgi:hypothetical protein